MSVKILNPGLLTTVQDLGRTGYQKYGVSKGGSCDPLSSVIANLLVGNPMDFPVLEFTLTGPMLKFETDTIFAITGGDMEPKLDGQPIPINTALRATSQQILSFGTLKTGCRGYIAFAGGLDLEAVGGKVMGSYSTDIKTNIGGFYGRKLALGDSLTLKNPTTNLKNMDLRTLPPYIVNKPIHTVHVVSGPQWESFTTKGIQNFLSEIYAVTNHHDRMGLRLEGPMVSHQESPDIISEAVSFGAVQVPGNGQPIVLLADCQTAGGYTKIAHAATADFGILGQLKSGDKLRFSLVTVEKATELLYIQREMLNLLEKLFQS